MTTPDEVREIVRSELLRLQEDRADPLTVNRAAKKLGLRKAHLKALIQRGKIATIPWPGKQAPFRIAAEEIARIQREGISVDPAPIEEPHGRKKKAGGSTDVSAQLARLKKLKVR